MKPIQVGFIGVGIAARDLHWPVLKQMPQRFRVCAVCGRHEKSAMEFAGTVGGVRSYTDYRELLQTADVEAVIICPPFPLNPQMTEAALAAGKHVLVEKPIASTLEDARRMVELERQSQLVTMVAENWRYRPALLRLKAYLQEGRIGQPFKVLLNNISLLDRENKYFKISTWRLSHPSQAMMMLDVGVHFASGLRLLFGEIKYGIALTTNILPTGNNIIDSMTFQFVFQNDVQGVVNYHLNSIGYRQSQLAVLGRAGSLVIEDEFRRLTVHGRAEHRVEEFPEDTHGFRAEFEDFYNAVRLGERTRSPFSEACGDLEMILYAIDSARSWNRLAVYPRTSV